MTFVEGEEVWALNLKYKDGTRLRGSPNDDSDFNGVWVGNDTTVRVVRSENHYVLVQKSDDTNGWIRERNLTREARKTGITKGVVSNQIVTPGRVSLFSTHGKRSIINLVLFRYRPRILYGNKNLWSWNQTRSNPWRKDGQRNSTFDECLLGY